MQRGHNRDSIFFDDDDYREYLILLKKNAEKYDCLIHAYVLMTNHVHLLLTPKSKDSVSFLFQGVGRQYVKYINKKYQRSGSLWEGRHKGNLIQSDLYLLRCMQYIELNPVRAHMVNKPEEYYWSSYTSNALDSDNSILTPHKIYLELSSSSDERYIIYNDIVGSGMNQNIVDEIGLCVQSGTPLGNQTFINQLENKLNRQVGYSKPGRPNNN